MKKRSYSFVENQSGVADFEQLYQEGIEKRKITYFREIWEKKNLSSLQLLAEQIYGLKGEEEFIDSDWSVSFRELSVLFQTNKGHISHLWKIGKNLAQGIKPLKPGGQFQLPDMTETQIFNYVQGLEQSGDPPEPQFLLEWINETFHTSFHYSWIYEYLRKPLSKIFPVQASPLEAERKKISIEDLGEYCNEAAASLVGIDPDFLFNCDESSDSPRSTSRKKIIVSTSNKPTTYKDEILPGHITFLSTICSCGFRVRPFIIISQQTMNSDLKSWGLPDSNLAKIVSSSIGLIT